ncbi:uncharacterized protein LOC122542069 isoform X3 [Chiloscyllium plagiosum]|uniref:uncharacterized protein LOC122542069 isoform X3 n=1 Tax=Chiloscyllium plagiosum TaxID=36176 RepID=UPI001CB7F59B|nr:uncharacterized protein LOC122542069 isoform X3 [Chiloscyllium plagiosum]
MWPEGLTILPCIPQHSQGARVSVPTCSVMDEDGQSLRRQKLDNQWNLLKQKQRRKRQDILMVQANPDAKVKPRQPRKAEEQVSLFKTHSINLLSDLSCKIPAEEVAISHLQLESLDNGDGSFIDRDICEVAKINREQTWDLGKDILEVDVEELDENGTENLRTCLELRETTRTKRAQKVGKGQRATELNNKGGIAMFQRSDNEFLQTMA